MKSKLFFIFLFLANICWSATLNGVADSLIKKSSQADAEQQKRKNEQEYFAAAQSKVDKAMAQAALKAFTSLKRQGVKFNIINIYGNLNNYCGRPVVIESQYNGEFVIYNRPGCKEAYVGFHPVGADPYILTRQSNRFITPHIGFFGV